MSNTFRDVVKSNLLKNWKPVKFRKREIISERLNETLGGLATEITLSGRYFSLIIKPTELFFINLEEKEKDKIKIEVKDMKKEEIVTFFFDLLYFS